MPPIDLLALERGYKPIDLTRTQAQPKKKGNLLTKLLPAIGGAAGIALAPFTGGGSLALLGLGALGGAAGKVAENKLEGQGAFDNPGQIALEGLFGAAGGGMAAFKAARAGKAAKTAYEAEQALRAERASGALGSLAAGSEAKAGASSALSQITEAQTHNNLARQNIMTLAEQNAKRGIPLGEAGNSGVLLRPGSAPSFASEGIELRPVPSVPYAPKAGAFDAYGVPLPSASGRGVGPTSFAPSEIVPRGSLKQRVLNTGEALKGEARGVKPGVSVPGTSKKLTGQAADEINAYLDTLGGSKSAHRQYRVVQQDLEMTGKKIGTLVATHDRPVSPQDITKIATKAADRAKNAIGFNADNQIIADVKGQLGSAKSLSDLRQVRSNLDDVLQNFYKQTERDSSTTATMKVVKGYRDGIDRVLSESIPGFKEVNTRYRTALKASEQLLNKANPPGLRFFGIQTGVGGEGLQAAKDLAGRAVGKVAGVIPEGGSIPSKATGNVMSLIKPVARQEVISATGNTALGRGPFGPQPEMQMNGNLTPEQAAAAEQRIQETLLASLTPEQRISLASGGDQGAAGGDAGSAFTYDQLQAAVAADPKNAATYFSLYDRANAENKSAKPLSASATTTVSNAETGLRGISDLQALMAQDPGTVKRTLIPGRSLFGGLLGNVFNTNSFDAARQQVVDVIARLRTGAAISKAEEERFLKFLPQPFDSPTVAQQKLGYLERQFQRVAAADPTAANEIQSVFNEQAGVQ